MSPNQPHPASVNYASQISLSRCRNPAMGQWENMDCRPTSASGIRAGATTVEMCAVVLGAVVGGSRLGALLLASFGAIMGVLLGGWAAALGWRTLGISGRRHCWIDTRLSAFAGSRRRGGRRVVGCFGRFLDRGDWRLLGRPTTLLSTVEEMIACRKQSHRLCRRFPRRRLSSRCRGAGRARSITAWANWAGFTASASS